MITSTGSDDLDRTTSGRFVRNLALSLSGGALITLLGATAAHAEDAGEAGTESAGSGAAHSGDATATGNQSNTSSTQTVTVSGNLGVIQVINQQANVSNVGVAAANTGGNIAIGNGSNNNANANQNGTGGTGSASNTGEASNGSNGTATISTGNASATGNHSTTSINQTAHGQAHGQLGGILIINQDATVVNAGVALANSGGNAAAGNISQNDAGLVQNATNDNSLAANSGAATNASNGKATVATGGASATGNSSDTQITQTASGSAGGALGGLVIIDQDAFVLNAGAAVANSGLNAAVGNASDQAGGQGADVDQTADGTGGGPGPVGIASNNGEASNTSDGTGQVWSGTASAVGNDSRTRVTQNATSDITGSGGGSLITQDSNVINVGFALANSGLNAGVGNVSENEADVDQDADSPGAGDVGVIGNFGKASNTSDGTGTARSGAATAAGNRSTTEVSQNAIAKGGAFALQTQDNTVANIGIGLANSGLNAGVGNLSDNDADVDQDAFIADPGSDVGVIGNFGLASNSSDGTGSVTTGAATAVGNDSNTTISQEIDPSGVVIVTQTAGVLNAGAAVANSGGNLAIGNLSDNDADADQDADLLDDNGTLDFIDIGTLVLSNNGEASNASDGTAKITTGNATATGNDSDTNLSQAANGNIGGQGVAVLTQVGGVANLGLGIANTGGNAAVGNLSDNDADLDQEVEGVEDNTDEVDVDADILTLSNSGTSSNSSDGTAEITTGNATATGNRSGTNFSQAADGSVDGLGTVVTTQVGGVANVGVGVANTGLNAAVGNVSDNETDLDQRVELASDNDDDVDIDAGTITASNAGTAENTSDGTAIVKTGAADATGNASSTNFTQSADTNVGGLGTGITTQIGGVANVGLGVANSGVNLAVGNNADNDGADGADLDQEIELGSENGDDVDIDADQLTVSNSGTASNASDGTGEVRTGGAQASGNVSSTNFAQSSTANVDGSGTVVNTQIGGVLNAGVGIANSGVNAAVGNNSENDADLDQRNEVGTDNGDDVDIDVDGALTASNSGTASNSSDGTGKVKTGGALATGNASATNLTQSLDGTVAEDGLGTVVGTQVGGVANVGLGVANSGINFALGNGSDNDADTDQDVEVAEDNGGTVTVDVDGPLTVFNSGEASNSSDGEACVCTGNAVASGNVSSTTLIQDLDLSVGTGTIVVTATGGVLNAGVGLANSGINAALGNISENDADADQDATLAGGGDLDADGPQTVGNSGGATNRSAGLGEVGSGNASGTGNVSTTDLVQAADIDAEGPPVVANIVGSTTNFGIGLANSGLNLGVGNDSTNQATLTQTADGEGTVTNSGTASNESDGTGQIGDPNCDEEPTPAPPSATPEEPTPGQPGPGALPRTGGELEGMAAVGLMLLLAGFGLRRKAADLA